VLPKKITFLRGETSSTSAPKSGSIAYVLQEAEQENEYLKQQIILAAQDLETMHNATTNQDEGDSEMSTLDLNADF